MVPQPCGLASDGPRPAAPSKVPQCTEKVVTGTMACLDACRRMQDASSDLRMSLKLTGASLSEWFPSAATAVAASLASSAAGPPQVSGPPWASLMEGARTLLVHIAALQAESDVIISLLSPFTEAQREFAAELRQLVETSNPKSPASHWETSLQRATAALGQINTATALRSLCERHLHAEGALSWSGATKTVPLKASHRGKRLESGKSGSRAKTQSGGKAAEFSMKVLSPEVRTATPARGEGYASDTPLRARLDETFSELQAVKSELNEAKAALSILRNRCRDKMGPGFYQSLSLPNVKAQGTVPNEQPREISVLDTPVVCTKISNFAPKAGLANLSADSLLRAGERPDEPPEVRAMRYQFEHMEKDMQKANRRLAESLEELANMQRVNFDLRALVRDLRGQVAVANMSSGRRVLVGTSLLPQEGRDRNRGTAHSDGKLLPPSSSDGSRRSNSAPLRPDAKGSDNHQPWSDTLRNGKIGHTNSSRDGSSAGTPLVSPPSSRQHATPKDSAAEHPHPPQESGARSGSKQAIKHAAVPAADEPAMTRTHSGSARNHVEPASPPLSTSPPPMNRQPSTGSTAHHDHHHHPARQRSRCMGNVGEEKSQRRSGSKQAPQPPGSARVKSLWQTAIAYAWRLVKVGRPGMVTHQRRAAVAILDLCKTYSQDFPDGEMGIYEFITQYAREEEFAMQVSGLAESVGRRKDMMQKKDFQTMQAEMTDSYNEAFESVGGQQVAEAHFEEANDAMRSLRRARGVGRFRQDVGFEILGLDALYERAHFANTKLMFEVRQMAANSKGHAICPDLKGRSRARAKVLTKYGNDTACLTDIMRASIVYQTVDDLYRALIAFITEDLHDTRSDFRLLEVTDRFQQPREGYRDVSMLCQVDGVIGEVQLHVQTIMLAKKGEGHDKYKKQRVVNEALFEACVRGYEDDVLTIMKKFRVAAAGVRDKHGRNAMHYSCQNCMVITTRLLLKYKADPWLADDEGVLPCELALKAGNFNVSEVVLRSMRLTAQNSHQGPILRLVKVVTPWWCDFVANMSTQSAESETGFREQWLRMGALLIGLILQNKAQKPLEDFMHRAAANGETGRVLTFLEVGFDPEPTSKGSVLDHVIEGGHAELARLLTTEPLTGQSLADFRCVRSPRGVERHLCRSSLNQDVRIAMAALAARADPNRVAALASAKRTPLMLFAAGGEAEMCRVLVKFGAQPHTRDKYGCAAVHYARALGHDRIDEYLNSLCEVEVFQSAELNFVEAIQNGCAGAVWRLITAQASGEGAAQDEPSPAALAALSAPMGPYRQTPLHLAVEAAATSVSDGAPQQNANDPTGQVCRALVRAGADVMARNTKNETPLHLAAAKGHRLLYRFLQEAVSLHVGAEELAAMEASDENWSGQTPKTLLERSIVRHGLRHAGQTRREDDLLLRVALHAFEHNLMTARLDSFGRRLETWREDVAVPMFDLLHQMSPSERMRAWKEAAVSEASQVLARGHKERSATAFFESVTKISSVRNLSHSSGLPASPDVVRDARVRGRTASISVPAGAAKKSRVTLTTPQHHGRPPDSPPGSEG
mmetsp:Transcript_42351/g.76861  ORF Transcript_42351/g.76861 Transcript_42351/m.76861 type:complete len:1558 (+) Transcript_42351:136-4809(+)